MLLDSLLRGVRGLRSRRLGAAGGRRCPSRAQGRLLRCEFLEERQLLSLAPAGIDWATYLGGSGSDGGASVAIDRDGSALVAGSTSSAEIAGANNSYHGGIRDAFVAKVNSDGSLAWVTYLGGSDREMAMAVAVDGEGNALVAGYTLSLDFVDANNTFHGGINDAFVAKVNGSDGSLAWATYLGGSNNESETVWYGVAVDGAGNAYVSSTTSSLDFYGANNKFHGGTSDAFVAKVNGDNGSLAWATYLGGGAIDNGSGIAVDGSGNAFVTGYTTSTDFEGANNEIHSTSHEDAFVAKIAENGSLVWSTYVGGSNSDGGWDIALDGAGNSFVIGKTSST